MTQGSPIIAAAFALAASGAALAQEVEFEFDDVLSVGETEISYRLEIGLSAVSLTRIGVVALLDLHDLQQRLPVLLTDEPVSEGCDRTTSLTNFAMEVREETVTISGDLDTELFECERIDESQFRRGDLTEVQEFEFSSVLTAQLSGKCVTFIPIDATLRPREIPEGDEDLVEDLQGLKVLLLEFAHRFLEKRPFCPEMPPELASLDPVYIEGGPREIGDGGLGLYLNGSINVSTTTILDIVRVLQTEEVIPGPP